MELREGSEATAASEANLASKNSAIRFSHALSSAVDAWISAMSVHGEIFQSLATGMLLLWLLKLATACEANEVE